MKTVLTYIFFMVILAPCLLMFNESDIFEPNIIGVAWLGVLVMGTPKKVAVRAYKALIRTNKQVERIIGF